MLGGRGAAMSDHERTEPLTLTMVRQSLKARKKYKWEAGETSVSRLAREPGNGVAHFGIGVTAAELAEEGNFAAFKVAPACSPPKALDWRNVNGQNFLTPIRNQQECGSCVSFAICAALEARDAIRKKDTDPTLDLSEAHLFFCGCGKCCTTGWHPSKGMEFVEKFGVGLEASFPYKPQNQPCKPKIQSVLKIKSSATTTTATDRRCALYLGGPVVGAMEVFADFVYYKGGIYKPTTSQSLGLHAISVIGYDDVEKYWIIKNSWGPGWGSGGFGRIAYGTTCGIDKQFPFWVPEL